jgi:Excalibur calcium-binding domain
MKTLTAALIAALLAGTVPAAEASAHPGGLNAQGCHNNRKTGDYHCHGNPRAIQPVQRAQSIDGDVYYASCKAAHADGRFNIRRGEPGYRTALDRDDDGIACEG